MTSPAGASDLALARGGFTDRLGKRLPLQNPSNPLLLALGLALLAWLPAALISLIEWAAGSRASLVIFSDLTTYARSWVAVPLLVLADSLIDLHVSDADGRFHELVVSEQQPLLDAMDRTVARLANHRAVTLVAAILAYVPVVLRFLGVLPDVGENWIHNEGGGFPISPAGLWYGLIGVPMFPFLLLQWIWRYAVWVWFVWKVSRLNLRLTASHPDGVAGLGFMDQVQASFHPLVAAISVMLAAAWAEAIQAGLATNETYAVPFAVFLGAIVAVFMLPSVAFVWRLVVLRVRGQRVFDFLVTRYNREFESRWVRPPAVDSPLGSPDIQSLNDMGGAFGTTHRFRVFLVSPAGAIPLVAAAGVPMLLPIGVSVPLIEVAKKLIEHLA